MQKSTEKKSKRSQRDYTLGFKLQVIAEFERGDLTYKQAQKKYGIQQVKDSAVKLEDHVSKRHKGLFMLLSPYLMLIPILNQFIAFKEPFTWGVSVISLLS